LLQVYFDIINFPENGIKSFQQKTPLAKAGGVLKRAVCYFII
jgi:hypothetical protein